MPMTPEEKVDFIYRIVLKIAEKEKWLSLSQLWLAEGELSPNDIEKAAQALLLTIQKKHAEGLITYKDVETVFQEIGFNKQSIKWIIGILYADYQDAVREIFDKIDDLPAEIKLMIRKIKRS